MPTASFEYNGVHLEHKGDMLYADGEQWALIGEPERSEREYVAIYLKYC